MSDEQTVLAVIAAAEQAAVAGDYQAAEQHLRAAVALQEAALGRVHPDLANTLNNLGVACERGGRLDEAEEAYRRAYQIAQEAFPPGHPFVIRSAENLRDFCDARDRPFDLSPPLVPVQSSVPAGTGPVSLGPVRAPGAPVPPVPSAPIPLVDPQPATPAPVHPRGVVPTVERGAQTTATRSLALPLSALAIVCAAAAIVVWLVLERDTPLDDGATSPVIVEAPAGTPAPPSAPPTSAAPDPGSPSMPTASGASGAKPAAASTIAIVRAEVCRNFLPRTGGAEWRCERVIGATGPGPLAFYTRLRSPRAATVEHRWYREDRLDHRARLRIGANPGDGYRTFSRNTIAAAEAGDWRVELRTIDGTLLHEARFTVR